MRDLCFLDSATDQVVPIPFKLTGECSGRALLAQRLITMLLRSVDDPARVDELGLAQRVGKSNVSGNADLENEFTLALTEAEDIIRSDQDLREDLDDSDRLDGVRLESLSDTEDSVSAVIAVVTVDGVALYASFTI